MSLTCTSNHATRHAFAALAAVLLLAATVAPASAHISLEQGGTHKSRSGDGNNALKFGPCGVAGSTRGTNIYTYEAGQTITVTLNEYIAHPSYFRIAFDDDGDDDFVDPASILPQDPARGCPCVNPLAGCTAQNDKCTASDFYNNATVLPEMDNLDPHISVEHGKVYSWQVKLPDVACDNCTLQIIQVMEDPLGHGPFDGSSDIYHQCIDLVLTPSATSGHAGNGGSGGSGAQAGDGAAGTAEAGAGGTGVGVAGTGSAGSAGAGAAGTEAAGGAGGAGSAGTGGAGSGTFGSAPPNGEDTGGCSAGGPLLQTGMPPSLLLALGMLAARRRRRSAR